MAQNGADATVAKAYVQIIPSARGIKENVTDVIAKEGATAGEGFGANFGAGLKKLGGAIVTAVKVAGAAAVVAGAAITKMAVDSYADYEQLTGGIETLYKDSADAVLANAQQAFRTAGMSANEYMETVMQFSGSLLQSVGGDTVKAAQMADMALRDMSDNANKMGTDIERLQDAYRGFARGNFTMLDNLSLGYGGTRSEMERLLADAEAISGIHYDISSYADMVDAIHVIQTEMGITGTTAEEAASTISGSWNALKASWDNLLVSLAGGGDDIETAVQAVFDSLLTWLGNIGPRVLEAVQGIMAAIPAVIETAWPTVSSAFMGFIEETFGSETAGAITEFADMVREKFGGMMERISQHLADFQAVMDEKVVPAFNTLKETLQPIIDVVVPAVIEVLAQFGSAVVGLLPIIADFVGGVLIVFNNLLVIAQIVWGGIKTTIEGVVGFVVSLVEGDFEGMAESLSGIWDGIKSTASSVWEGIKSVASTVWDGIKSAIEGPINTAKSTVKNAIDAIKGFFNFEFHWPHIPLPHFSISGSANPLDWLSGGLPHISVSWYAKGGIVDGATLIGAGEAGPEAIIPLYEPYFSKWGDMIAERMDVGSGTVNNYYIDGNMVAADAALAAALDTVAQRVGGRRRMGVA